ncbi:hypothetical protein RUM43_010044 [Polyplax serrata]|uniref:Uncharacterized protein n=1 Tax=Polyplax serrata TaxID=468196 RepID=A0AAN8S4M0_POLSC
MERVEQKVRNGNNIIRKAVEVTVIKSFDLKFYESQHQRGLTQNCTATQKLTKTRKVPPCGAVDGDNLNDQTVEKEEYRRGAVEGNFEEN